MLSPQSEVSLIISSLVVGNINMQLGKVYFLTKQFEKVRKLYAPLVGGESNFFSIVFYLFLTKGKNMLFKEFGGVFKTSAGLRRERSP